MHLKRYLKMCNMFVLILLLMMGNGGGGSRRKISIPTNKVVKAAGGISIPTEDISIPTNGGILSLEMKRETAFPIAIMSAEAPFPLPALDLESPMEPSPARFSTQGDNSSAASLAEVKT